MANPNLQKVIKLTQSQYNILANGGTVGDFTGLNDNYLYLIQEDYDFPVTTTARKILMSTSTAGLVAWQSLIANDIPSLDASKITSGIFSTARIPSLAASKITSGTFDAARIPNLDASKITSGTFADARIASASTWNAKYTKPSGGIPASDLSESYALSTHNHDNRYLKLSGGVMTGNISYQGTKATYTMIKFLDNTGDTYGNGISIGGGGAVVVGAGESADAIISGAGVSGGTETLYLGSDSYIYLFTNVQDGYASAKTFVLDTSGNLAVPGSITEAGTTLANKYAAKSHTHTKSQITDFPTSMPASDVYAWAKAATKPSYTLDEVSDGSTRKLSDYLTKITYEWNKDISFGSSGYLKIGSFQMYDSNVTINIDATTTQTFHGTVVIASQNTTASSIGSTHIVRVYDDPSGIIADSLRIVWTNGSRNYDVYFVPQRWSKNIIHIRANGIYGATDVCISQTGNPPSTTSGLEPVNVLTTTFLGINAKAVDADKLNGQTANYYLNYNNLSNKPTIPTKSSWNYDDVYVKYSAAQTLTDAQKTQARSNIGAGTSSFTGYTSSNKLSTNYIQNDAGWSSFSGYSSSNKLHTDYINNVAGWTSVTESTVSGWGFTKNIGTVTSITLGLVAYNPDSGGVIALPAYPTSLPASDVYSWAKAATKPTYTASEVGALASDAKVVLYTSQSLTTLQKSTARSNIGAGTSSLALGETATTAAAGNHKHTLSIASGGSSPTALAADTTYTLTAGGNTLVFKTPAAGGGSAYYANKYNQYYYFSNSSNPYIASKIGLTNLTTYNYANLYFGFDSIPQDYATSLSNGHNIETFSRAFIMNFANASGYMSQLVFGTVGYDITKIYARNGNAFAGTTGEPDAVDNLGTLYLVASSLNASIARNNSLYEFAIGRKNHCIHFSSGSNHAFFNILNSDYFTYSAYYQIAGALYNAGHRSLTSFLRASGIYGSYTKPVVGVYATNSTTLWIVYMNGTTVSSSSFTSGTVADSEVNTIYEP